MQAKYNYWYFQSELTKEKCDDILILGKNKLQKIKDAGGDTAGKTADGRDKISVSEKNPSQVISQSDKTVQEIDYKKGNTYIRDSEVCWLNDKWLYNLFTPYIEEANKCAGWNYQWDFCESFQFTKYNPGGFYGWHNDCSTDHFAKYKRHIPGVTPLDENGLIKKHYTDNHNFVGKIRKLSMTVNLNVPGEYEGGNLKFDYGPHAPDKRFHECTEIRPQGSIIVFPSWMYHQVTPIEKGTRYSIVLWCLGKPFK